jgi:uncharacterized DUF497 family protein
MNLKNILTACTGFEWDEGNFDKNLFLHGITAMETEEVFFNHPLLTGNDEKHSRTEKRYYCLGHSDCGNLLFIAFTLRGRNIRVISARMMTFKEKRIYLSL